jgi:hypothetical protein
MMCNSPVFALVMGGYDVFTNAFWNSVTWRTSQRWLSVG